MKPNLQVVTKTHRPVVAPNYTDPPSDILADRHWQAKFWIRVKQNPESECWEWQGSKRSEDGYGCVSYRARNYGVHRLSWLLWHGSPVGDWMVLHSCDNPRCLNPIHLRLGNSLDNAADAKERKRFPWLTATHCLNGHALTEDNIYVYHYKKNGVVMRKCKECMRNCTREWRARQKEAANAQA